MRRSDRVAEVADLPLWYRPVVVSRHTADSARLAARLLTRLGYLLVTLACVGDFWHNFDQGTTFQQLTPQFRLSYPLDHIGRFAIALSVHLAEIGLVFLLGWWLTSLAGQLDVEILRANDAAASDLAAARAVAAVATDQ